MKKVYSYIRFSSTKQAFGDSHRRQSKAIQDWLSSHPDHILDESLSFEDLGRSAFHGDHLKEGGALRAFLEAVKQGLIPPDSVLLVESLDRVSRQSISHAQETIRAILEQGITVVTLSDGETYNRQSLDDSLALIRMIILQERSHNESVIKSDRIRKAWSHKRQQFEQDGTKITGNCPGWLKLNSDGKSFSLIPHHVETIHRIFNEKLSGKSLHAIARDLNLENIPTITNKKVDTGWTPTRVRDLLLKESLIGVAYGVSDYFPPAISKEKFHAVQMIRGQGKGKKPTSQQPSSIDIFKGLCKCAECDSTLRQRNTKKTPEGRYPRGYLECRNRLLGRCNSKAFNRSLIEDILIQKVFPTLQYLSLKGNGDNISVTTLKADITSLEKGINNLINLAEKGLGDLDTLAQRITSNRVELESKKKDLRQAEAIQSLKSDNDIQDSDRKTVEGRIKLQLAIKSFVKEIIFDYYKQEITIRLLNGKSFSGISVAREDKDFDHSSMFEVLQKSLLDIDEVHL